MSPRATHSCLFLSWLGFSPLFLCIYPLVFHHWSGNGDKGLIMLSSIFRRASCPPLAWPLVLHFWNLGSHSQGGTVGSRFHERSKQNETTALRILSCWECEATCLKTMVRKNLNLWYFTNHVGFVKGWEKRKIHWETGQQWRGFGVWKYLNSHSLGMKRKFIQLERLHQLFRPESIVLL